MGSKPVGALLAMLALLLAMAPAAKADELKDQAIARLVESHEADIPIAIGRVVVMQAGLKALRARLAEAGRRAGLDKGWNERAAEWIAAEARLEPVFNEISVRRLEQGTWLQEGWARVAAAALTAEEADEIAAHFANEGGREQRVVVELVIVGETVMANYTFTDRLDYRMRGTEADVAKLQETWWAREPLRVRNFSRYPGALRFAGEDPGIKYTRALAIQGIGVILDRIDRTAEEVVAQAAALDVEPFIAAYRRRSAGAN
jgi:hypothetical protein